MLWIAWVVGVHGEEWVAIHVARFVIVVVVVLELARFEDFGRGFVVMDVVVVVVVVVVVIVRLGQVGNVRGVSKVLLLSLGSAVVFGVPGSPRPNKVCLDDLRECASVLCPGEDFRIDIVAAGPFRSLCVGGDVSGNVSLRAHVIGQCFSAAVNAVVAVEMRGDPYDLDELARRVEEVVDEDPERLGRIIRVTSPVLKVAVGLVDHAFTVNMDTDGFPCDRDAHRECHYFGEVRGLQWVMERTKAVSSVGGSEPYSPSCVGELLVVRRLAGAIGVGFRIAFFVGVRAPVIHRAVVAPNTVEHVTDSGNVVK